MLSKSICCKTSELCDTLQLQSFVKRLLWLIRSQGPSPASGFAVYVKTIKTETEEVWIAFHDLDQQQLPIYEPMRCGLVIVDDMVQCNPMISHLVDKLIRYVYDKVCPHSKVNLVYRNIVGDNKPGFAGPLHSLRARVHEENSVRRELGLRPLRVHELQSVMLFVTAVLVMLICHQLTRMKLPVPQ